MLALSLKFDEYPVLEVIEEGSRAYIDEQPKLILVIQFSSAVTNSPFLVYFS